MSVASPPSNPRSARGIVTRVLAVLAMAAVLVGGFVLISRNVNTGGLVAIGAGLLWFPAAGAGFLFLARGRSSEQKGVLATVALTGLALGAVLFATSRGNEVDEKIVTGAPAAAPAAPAAEGAEAQGGSAAAGGDSRADSGRSRARENSPRGRRARNARTRNGGSSAKGSGDPNGAPAGPNGEAATAGSGPGSGDRGSSAIEDRRTPAPIGNVRTLSGSFSGESGHRGSGKAAVVELPSGERKLTFSEFDVDPGAGGLRVYLTAGTPGSDADVTDFEEIGGLKGTKGDQQYDIPRSIDLKRYGTVVIWCVPFTTRIAQANLR